MAYFPSVSIQNTVGDQVKVTNNGLDINIQDQHTELIDLHMVQQEGTFTLSAGTSIDDPTFAATAGHGISVGDTVCIQEGTAFYQAQVLTVVTNTIGIDSPLDYAFTTSASCTRGNINLNIDGSVTPVTFRISPSNLTDGTKWDVVRVLFQITDDTVMDDSKFGGIAALTNGVVLRVKNGTTKNIFNSKSNSDFAAHAYDTKYSDKAPSGSYGFSCRRTFGGQSKNGVVVRLNSTSDDEFQLIVQDNLTALSTFHVIAQGHVVE